MGARLGKTQDVIDTVLIGKVGDEPPGGVE